MSKWLVESVPGITPVDKEIVEANTAIEAWLASVQRGSFLNDHRMQAWFRERDIQLADGRVVDWFSVTGSHKIGGGLNNTAAYVSPAFEDEEG